MHQTVCLRWQLGYSRKTLWTKWSQRYFNGFCTYCSLHVL